MPEEARAAIEWGDLLPEGFDPISFMSAKTEVDLILQRPLLCTLHALLLSLAYS